MMPERFQESVLREGCGDAAPARPDESAAMRRPYIIGERIYLRALERADLAHYIGWVNDWTVTEYMETGDRPATQEGIEQSYGALINDPNNTVFTMVEKGTDRPVGTCGLHLIQWVCRRAEFRILLGERSVWGRGYGTEAAKLNVHYAFDRLNLVTVYLGVNAENKRAIVSYERAGFKPEGTRRRLIFRNNRYYDVLMMSILREEYESSRIYEAFRRKAYGAP